MEERSLAKAGNILYVLALDDIPAWTKLFEVSACKSILFVLLLLMQSELENSNISDDVQKEEVIPTEIR